MHTTQTHVPPAAPVFPDHSVYPDAPAGYEVDHHGLDALNIHPDAREPWNVHTPISSMIDNARDNVTWGMEYLTQHPVPDFDNIMNFFKDTADTLTYFRTANVYGHKTAQYLKMA